MITLLAGENSYEREQTLGRLTRDTDAAPETFDGAEIDIERLPDLLMGMSLFSEKRLVVIRGLSQNKMMWDAVPEWLPRMSDDIHLVLVEMKPDKRTKTYKALKKAGNVHEFALWTDRDERSARQWVQAEAKTRGTSLDARAVQLLVERVGVDQWRLATTLDMLSVYEVVTEDIIREAVEARPQENVFTLFETALKGEAARVEAMLRTLSLTEEPYQLFGLLSGQAIQLAALVTERDHDDVAKDFGVHPFVIAKLRPYAAKVGLDGARRSIAAFAEADEVMKTTAIEPWIVIERTLLALAKSS